MYSSEENNNEESEGGKTETTQENQNETPMIGMVERTALYILRNQNWICVLLLTPISLMYDLYCFCKYNKNINMIYESYTHNRGNSSKYIMNNVPITFSKFLVCTNFSYYQN